MWCPPGTEDFTKLTVKIHEELDRFDGEVLRQLQTKRPDLADIDVPTMRADMHATMMGALQEFAEKKGIPGASFTSFKQFFDAAKDQDIELNPFTYMDEFKERLFEKSSMVKDITGIAQEQAGLPGPDGKSHLDRMTSILSGYGARAVMYDAVTLAAAHTVEKSPELAAHFAETDGTRNVTQAKVTSLRESNPDLYREFSNGIRAELSRDGGALAIAAPHRDSTVSAREPTTTTSSSTNTQERGQKRSATEAGLAEGPEYGAKRQTYRTLGAGDPVSVRTEGSTRAALAALNHERDRDRDRSPVR